jgi:spectinomycin phosphotransferase/16S rRNA (guanine(1405)-N(7))-methyltransferase
VAQVLTPPDSLAESDLVPVLRRGWDLDITSLAYRAVGWGSHHWEATDAVGGRWFITVDDLEQKQLRDGEPLTAAFSRLRASLGAAADLRRCGGTFVLGPVLTHDREPVAPVTERFAIAVYPFVDGQSFSWGEFAPGQRRAVLALVTGVHTAPAGARRRALTDDFAVPCRAELEAACDLAAAIPGGGPYASRVTLLLRQNAAAIQQLLARYDGLVAQARSRPGRMVLTHGEPHPGNTLLAADGSGDGRWLLIDWDTALIAPPERDLWLLDPGDGTILSAYAEATGVAADPALVELYRLGWDIKDLAVDARRLRRPHAGSADDEKTWQVMSSLVEHVAGQDCR